MKTIVVSGARSNTGKTSLAREICRLLPGAVHIKIGHGIEKDGIGNIFYSEGTGFERIASENESADFLVIESNGILEEIDPDCAIFLTGSYPKPSARAARAKADIVRGEKITDEKSAKLSESLGVDEGTVLRIASLAGAVRPKREGRGDEAASKGVMLKETGKIAKRPMVPFEESLRIVLDSAGSLEGEEVPLDESTGRVLCEDIRSDIDMPPFDKSAMDGYACRSADIGGPLEVVETIPAGKAPSRAIGEGECAKIMTGAIVPDGADCVVMIEDTKIVDGLVRVDADGTPPNICYRGEDIKAGDVVLEKGTIIGPAHLAVLAGAGRSLVPVSRKPVVGIIATGSELVPYTQVPGEGKIRNSNSSQLAGQCALSGFEFLDMGIVGDEPVLIARAIEKEMSRIDVLLLSGGVSMGDYDFVTEVLREAGFDLLFESVAIKPGKPLVFGVKYDRYVFGLPGNPASTFILFELYVKPFCFKLMGASYRPRFTRTFFDGEFKREKTGRRAHIPVMLSPGGGASPVDYHGSAHIRAFALADGFVAIPQGVAGIGRGEEVEVRLL